jgi:hypothetical protein
MSKKTLLVKRLTSFTLLKVMLITFMFPWLLIDTGIILFHLLSGDYFVEITTMSKSISTIEQIPIGRYVLISYPVIVLITGLMILMFWVSAAFSLWLWSLFRPMEVTYYETNLERENIKTN